VETACGGHDVEPSRAQATPSPGERRARTRQRGEGVGTLAEQKRTCGEEVSSLQALVTTSVEAGAHVETRGAAMRRPATGSPLMLAETGEASTSVEEQTVASSEAK